MMKQRIDWLYNNVYFLFILCMHKLFWVEYLLGFLTSRAVSDWKLDEVDQHLEG